MKISLFAAVCCALLAPPALSCQKKGIGMAEVYGIGPAQILRTLNAHWYYDWVLDPPAISMGAVRFVPMLNGKPFRFATDLDKLHSLGPQPLLLGFNEPDLAVQAHMTVDEAIRLWAKVEQNGAPVGSPAASTYGTEWIEEFMRKATLNTLRVNFIAVHYYGPPDPSALLARIDGLHKEFRRPIWITEFALWNKDWRNWPDRYSPADAVRFLSAVVPALEKRPYVERYAWFGLGIHSKALAASRFFDELGHLTPVGLFYSRIEQGESGTVCGQPSPLTEKGVR